MAKIPHMNYPYISQDVVIIQEGQPGQVSATVQVTERSWLFDPEEFDIIEIPPSQDHHVHASLEDQGGITIDQIEFGSGEYLEFGPLAESSPPQQNYRHFGRVWGGDSPPPSPVNLTDDPNRNYGPRSPQIRQLSSDTAVDPRLNNTFVISDSLEGPAAQGLNEIEFGPLAESSPPEQNYRHFGRVWGDDSPPPSPVNLTDDPNWNYGPSSPPAGMAWLNQTYTLPSRQPPHCLNDTNNSVDPRLNNTIVISDSLEGPAAQGLNETYDEPPYYPGHNLNETYNIENPACGLLIDY